MSREAHIAKYVQKALMDAALELWKDEVAAERDIFRRELAPELSQDSFRCINSTYISRFYVSNDPYFLRGVAVLPDGTEEELIFFGFQEWCYDSSRAVKIKVSWNEIPLLEDLSQKALLIERAFKIIDEEPMDELKKKHPCFLKFFDAAYESWSVTYRAVEALKDVLSQ